MTPVREAFVLPALFLTTALLGGLRVTTGQVRLLPPAVIALVLGVLLLATLIRGGVLLPWRFLGPRRAPVEKLSGGIVLATLGIACAQVFNLVTPDRGLLHAIFSVFFLVQLLTTLAGVRERDACLRSLLVLLGSAFVLRFVVLEAIYAPQGGTLTRLLTVLMEGVTLGTLQYDPHAPVTGYAAFVALALFFVGLTLLPRGSGDRPSASTALTAADAGEAVLTVVVPVQE